jgi:hypothetical protein
MESSQGTIAQDVVPERPNGFSERPFGFMG